jgi:hypothetical protein
MAAAGVTHTPRHISARKEGSKNKCPAENLDWAGESDRGVGGGRWHWYQPVQTGRRGVTTTIPETDIQ